VLLLSTGKRPVLSKALTIFPSEVRSKIFHAAVKQLLKSAFEKEPNETRAHQLSRSLGHDQKLGG